MLFIIAGQFFYLPNRVDFLQQLVALAGAKTGTEKARLVYRPADYDLLEWVRQATPREATLLLLTASSRTYGGSSYVLYHRAVYHLAPRSVWWAAPVPTTRYPAWWSFTNLSEVDVLALAKRHQVDAILADGFIKPPVPEPFASFDEDTHLIFLKDSRREHDPRSRVQGLSFVDQNRWLTFIKMVGGLLAILAWGDVLYKHLGQCLTPSSLTHRLAIAWLLGCGLTSLATFVLLWAGLSLVVTVLGLSLVGLLLWFPAVLRHAWLKKKELCLRPQLPRLTPHASRVISNPWLTLFTLTILVQVSLIAFAALLRPLIDWDAWVNWAGKANLLFIEQTISPNVYNNPARLPTNLDYPLMLPLLEAWFYTWLGQIYEPSAGMISFLFYLALLLLFFHATRQLVPTTAALGFTALLAAVPRLERLAHSGLADVPLAALVFLAFVLVFYLFDGVDKQTDRRRHLAAVVMLGLATGLLPWLKNEGWLWLVVITLCWLVGVGRQVWRGLLSTKQAIGLTTCYGIVALALPLLWQLFLIRNGTERFTFLPITFAHLWAYLHRYPVIVFEIGKRLLNPYWNFIWPLAGLTLLLQREKIFQSITGWLILPILGYLVLISATYILSRFDPYLAHLNNSVERLILQAASLMVWWLVGQYKQIRDLEIGD